MTDILTKGKVFKDDLSLWTGSTTTTATRKTSTGGVQTLSRFDWVGVDVYAIYGATYGKNDVSIQTAINEATSADLFLNPGTWEIENDLTIPAGFCLIIPQGATVSIDSGKTLTINGDVKAGRDQIFTGDGSVAVGGYTGQWIFEYWFNGATMTGTVPTTCIYLETDGGVKIAGSTFIINESGQITTATTISDTLSLTKSSGTGLAVTSSATIGGSLSIGGVALTATPTELNQLDAVEVGGTASGDIVTTDGTQTLTNKTIDGTGLTLTTPTLNGAQCDSTGAEVDYRCDGYPIEYGAENGGSVTCTTSAEQFAETDLGTVAIGDRILVFADVEGDQTVADGMVNISIVKYSGTSSVKFGYDKGEVMQSCWVPNGGNARISVSSVIKVDGAGTLGLRLRGITSAGTYTIGTGDGTIHAVFEKKQ